MQYYVDLNCQDCRYIFFLKIKTITITVLFHLYQKLMLLVLLVHFSMQVLLAVSYLHGEVSSAF